MTTEVLVEHGPDAGAVWHHGDPVAEQRALVAGTAAVDLSHRPVLRVSGPDRLTWLHSLTSQHLEQLAPGVGTQALVLSPHGHVEHHLALVDDGTSTLIHVEPGTAEPLLAYLDSMRFWSQVEVADVSEEIAVVLDNRPTDDEITAVRRGYGRERLVARGDLESVLSSYDRPAGLWAAEALRVAAAEPRLGFETDHRTIPHELGWIGPAVHLDKGCYRGQETVARVQNLGRPPRRLVLLHLDGSEHAIPEHCADVRLDDRTVGWVGTAVRHHELGPIALAIVKRNIPTDATLTVDGLAAAQEVVVAA